MIRGKAILKVAPGLAKLAKGAGLFLIMLITIVSIGAIFAGYFMDTTVVHRPLDVFGVCPPPAILGPVGGFYGVGSSVQCYVTVPQSIIVNGQSQTIYVQQPAGNYIYLNGSAAHP